MHGHRSPLFREYSGKKVLGASETLTQIFVSTELSHLGVSVWVLNLGRYVCQGGG